MIVTIRGEGKSSAVEVQINARVRIPRGFTLRKEVIAEAIRFKAENGTEPNPNIELSIVRWRRGDGDWIEGGDSETAWRKFAGLLRRARLDA